MDSRADAADQSGGTYSNRTILAAATVQTIRLAPAPAAPAQHILAVWFRSPGGLRWHAVGGGATVAEAIAAARESCPGDSTWNAVRWNALYGD